MKRPSRKLSPLLPRPLRPLATRAGLERKWLWHALHQAALHVRVALGGAVTHGSGPVRLALTSSQVAVACVVRNGMPWLEAFLAHYRRLGVRHLAFVDNGSTDGTREMIASQPDTSLFVTALPFARYKVPLKRWLMDRFGAGGWSLYCDVDEFFDYPYSDRLPLPLFLEYLNRRDFTAVAAQMLDMFSDEPLAAIQGRPDADLDQTYRFYDVAAITRSRDKYWIDMNELGSSGIMHHGEGIRASAFGWTGSMLTKHPLVRHGHGVRVFPYDDHFVTGARLADVTAVLRHYKFTGAFLAQIADYTSRRGQFDNPIYSRYREVMNSDDRLSLAGKSAEAFDRPESLLRSGFLIASGEYLDWVRQGGFRRFPS